MPRQIPKNGLSCIMYSLSGSVKPFASSVFMALPNDPTPGNTITLQTREIDMSKYIDHYIHI